GEDAFGQADFPSGSPCGFDHDVASKLARDRRPICLSESVRHLFDLGKTQTATGTGGNMLAVFDRFTLLKLPVQVSRGCKFKLPTFHKTPDLVIPTVIRHAIGYNHPSRFTHHSSNQVLY